MRQCDSPGAGSSQGRASRHQGHFALHHSQEAHQGRWVTRTQRRQLRGHLPQTRLPGLPHHPACLRRKRRLPRMAGRRSQQGAGLHVPDDERRPHRRGSGRGRDFLRRLLCFPGIRQGKTAGTEADLQGSAVAADSDHRARGYPSHAPVPESRRGRVVVALVSVRHL